MQNFTTEKLHISRIQATIRTTFISKRQIYVNLLAAGYNYQRFRSDCYSRFRSCCCQISSSKDWIANLYHQVA